MLEALEEFSGTTQLDDRDALAVNRCTPGIAQEVAGSNLGYGQLYYALTRLLRPRTVLVIGSGYGFTPGTIALALKHDGGRGRVLFVDPGYSGAREGPERAHGGSGVWARSGAAQQRFSCLGVQNLVTHYRERNDEFFPKYASRRLPRPDLTIIDGAHDLENAAYDTENVLRVMKIPGFVLLHDAVNWWHRVGEMGVNQVIRELALDHEVLTIPGRAGLSLVRVMRSGRRFALTAAPPPQVLGLGALVLGMAFGLGWLFGRRT